MVGQDLPSRQCFQMLTRGRGFACSKVDLLDDVEPGYLATGNTDRITAHRGNGGQPFPLRSLTKRASVGADLKVGLYKCVAPTSIDRAGAGATWIAARATGRRRFARPAAAVHMRGEHGQAPLESGALA